MIKTFYIQNFCSIKDKVEISFEASKLSDTTSFENTFKYRQYDILKTMSFYGANASGKSSIIKALAALRELVVPGPFLFNNMLPYFPFSFSKETINSPIQIGIEFSLNHLDGPLFKYDVSYDNNAILFEKLEKYSSQKPSLLYERKLENGVTKLSFGSSIQNNILVQQIGNSVAKNRTFLSMFSNFEIEDFSDAYKFFFVRLINISPEVTRFDDLLPLEFKNNDKLKKFAEQLLKAADFDIQGIEITKKRVKNINPAPGFYTEFEKDTLVFNHQGIGCGGQIEFVNESLGTKKILILAINLYRALQQPSVLIVDELESSLHPDLARLIVEMFLDDTINVHNSQLVFTSHNAALLDLELFRREQINFVYKDKDDCSTFVRSLKDFHVRKNDSIDKSYLAGRFSTSPDINKELL